MNALVHAIEINDRHGVGVYVRRMFGEGKDFVLFRSRTLYAGENAFGEREVFLGDRFATLEETRRRIAACANETPIERILCIPYYAEDFRHAVMLKEATGARLCTYLMDDQNVFSREVGDRAVRRLLEASDLRLGISPQMGMAYERKFGMPMAWMPPVVPARRSAPDRPVMERRTALIGNLWSRTHLENLRNLARESGWTVDWFGRGPDASWLGADPDALEADGVRVCGFLDDEAFAERLAEYPFAIVPTGTADDADDIRSFSLLSLPSRIPHLLTQAGIPIVVLGSEQTAAAAFVQEMECGEVSAWESADFLAAADRIRMDRAKILTGVTAAAERLVLSDAGDWLWRSLDAGTPADERFESMRSGRLARLDFDVPGEKTFAPRARRGWVARKFGGLGDFESLRFSRVSQLRAIRKRTPIEVTGPHTFEVSGYQRALAVTLVRDCVRSGGRVGVLAGEPTWLRGIRDTHGVEAVDERARGLDAVVSFQCEGLLTVDDLNAMTVSGGLHVHCWTAFLRPGHFHAPGAAMRMLDEMDDVSRVTDEILDADDFLFMSPKAIERFWQPVDLSAATAAGRPFSLNLCWRS